MKNDLIEKAKCVGSQIGDVFFLLGQKYIITSIDENGNIKFTMEKSHEKD